MPKQTFTINDFSGGVNGYVDPLDIADNELALCQGFLIEPGVISVLGDMKGLYTLGASVTAASGNIDVESGYGLFAFSHDYDMAGGATDAGTNLALDNTDYFIMMSRLAADKHNKFDVFDTADNVWRTDMIDLGGSKSDARMASIKPCFFVADGAVRISPGNFASVNSGGDLVSGVSGDFVADTNPGGFEEVATDAGFDNDITPGDTIIVGTKLGQEMVALITADQALTAARNMTGSFPGALDVDTDSDDVYVMPDTRWRGVVKRRNFPQAGTRGTFTEWYSTYAHPRPPVSYTSSLEVVATQYTMPFLVRATTSDATVDGTTAPLIWITYMEDGTNDDATWDGAVINLYCTALYDEAKQESQPNKIASAVPVLAADELGLGVVIDYADGAGTPADTYLFNKRTTGARVYYEDTVGDPGILYQLLEIDFEKGCKKAESETFTPWVEKVTDECVASHADAHDASQLATTPASGDSSGFIFVNPPKAFTYEFNAQYPPDVNTHARYKTAVISNRRLFVGNVYQSGKANGDRMISSPVNKFDILPEFGSFIIDVTQGDGDEIVKLEAYADRVLQFKKRTLYIVNVAGGLGEEFLESQHRNMGVENPSQTCMTEYGVAWVNTHGVFLYDGQEITDLTREKLKMTHTTSGERSRALNVTESNVPLIGYHPDNKWLVVHPQSIVTDANDVEAWIHDFKNGAWTNSQELTITDEKKSNMVWTGDNNLVLASVEATATPNFYKYQDSTSCDSGTFGVATKLLLLTKEFHLNAPGVKKKLRSVYITYSASANSRIEADVIYKHITGATTTEESLEEANSGSTYYTNANGFLSTSGNVRTVELVPVTPVNNAYTFQLKLHNPDAAYPEGADFKLYNISFAYRPLGVR